MYNAGGLFHRERKDQEEKKYYDADLTSWATERLIVPMTYKKLHRANKWRAFSVIIVKRFCQVRK